MNSVASSQRVRGLDTIRLALALCVVFCHIGLPIAVDPSAHSFPWSVIGALYANAFNGPAAVVCFFVVSGFCIHFPFRNIESLSLIPYFSRRHIRIWVPIIAAVVIASQVQLKVVVFGDSILWSLIAEEIYYVLYPGLRWIARKYSWMHLIAPAFGAAVLVILTNPTAMEYPSYGMAGNWILGLPCWLMGCLIAHRFDRDSVQHRSLSTAAIWGARVGIVAVGTLCSVIRFHASIGSPWSLTLFSPLVYLWLREEIRYSLAHPPILILEKLGMMTYSIYLTHLLAHKFLQGTVGPIQEEWLPRWGYFVAVFAMTTVFYLMVERPSHLLARWVGNWLSQKLHRKPTMVPVTPTVS